MCKPFSYFCIALGTTLLVAAKTAENAPAEPEPVPDERLAGKVVVLKVGDAELGDARKFRKMRELIDLAAVAEAEAVVFDINAPGNHPVEAFRRIAEEFPGTGVKMVSFVHPTAVSAGAALALSTDVIYMSPVGALGAAAPPVPAGKDNEGALRAYEREVSVLSAQLKGIAKTMGHDPDIVAALTDPGLELKDGDTVVKASGKPLTLSAEEAVGNYAGRSALSAGIASSIEEVVSQAGLTGDVTEVDPQVFEKQEKGESVSGAGVVATAGGKEKKEEAAFGQTRQESYGGKVVIIKIGEEDLASKAQFEFMKRCLVKAGEDKAEAVVFDINTPGGYAWYTAQLMMQELQRFENIKTISYVNPAAVSAGSLIAIATDDIYMAPASTIGAAAVVSGTGGDIGETMQKKVNATMISIARNVAELKGHNPDIAEAFIDYEKEVVIAGAVVSKSGDLLSLNATTATEMLGGKPVLAKGIAKDLDEVLTLEGLDKDNTVKAEPLGMEAVARWVQAISGFLILLGIAGAYMEMQTPGFGVPGFVSLAAFTLFFFGNNLAGKLAGYELVVVFVIGVALIVVELFVAPGTLVFGLAGAALMLGSLMFAMVDKLDVEAIRKGAELAPSSIDVVSGPALTLALGLAGAALLIALAMVYLPKSKAMRWMVLEEAVAGGTPGIGVAQPGGDKESLVGRSGVTISDLRPVGRARFADDVLEVTAGSEFITEGKSVRVIEHEGSRVLVEEIG